MTWDITSQWALTGGLRYYKFDNSLQGFFGYSLSYDNLIGSSEGMVSCFAPPSTKCAPCIELDSDVSNTGTVPRVNLTYKVTPEQMVYATYSKGFRPRGVNGVTGIPPYAADYLTNYELGWKTQWFDRRLRDELPEPDDSQRVPAGRRSTSGARFLRLRQNPRRTTQVAH